MKLFLETNEPRPDLETGSEVYETPVLPLNYRGK